MPKSRRTKAPIVSKTGRVEKKHGKRKDILVDKIRESVEEYNQIFILELVNQRSRVLQEMRLQLEHSKFVFGRNKVIGHALGKTPEDEFLPGISNISMNLRGQSGLLFSNASVADVREFCNTFHRDEFARAGSVSPQTVVIPAGRIMRNDDVLNEEDDTQVSLRSKKERAQGMLVTVDTANPSPESALYSPVPVAMDSLLRSYGLPTFIRDGSIVLDRDFTVCKEGDKLSDKAAQILRQFGHKLSRSEVHLVGVWNKDTSNYSSL
ncbi:putative Ribosome assembly factor mrt4 [Blattamonas nauphoetae]|uniref:Ribosome assembly factor mrt4 n=1 Tax=Blattamonas nauphoetae TaxID=2049346 RepID=A0ABQ9XXS2_9EUKA|nr:putative Ribosome assembly factor mrt4 [Blattamonas nauphoetae]